LRKIEAKIDQNFGASWGRILDRFWWILGGKMRPSWHQKRIKNRSQLREAHFTKNTIKLNFNDVLVFGDRSWDQKSIKNQ